MWSPALQPLSRTCASASPTSLTSKALRCRLRSVGRRPAGLGTRWRRKSSPRHESGFGSD
jgi:hypothetical protein